MDKLFEPNLEFETYIARPIEDVFDALTQAHVWDRWFTTGMELNPVVGGKMLFKWQNWGPHKYSGEDAGEVVIIDRPDLFEFKWHGNSNIPMTLVSIRLSKMDDGTHLQLTETGYLDNPRGRAWLISCSTGWGEAMTLLKLYLEHGVNGIRRH